MMPVCCDVADGDLAFVLVDPVRAGRWISERLLSKITTVILASEEVRPAGGTRLKKNVSCK